MRHPFFAIAFTSLAIACSSTSSGGSGSGLQSVDATSTCNRLINECKQAIPQDQCQTTFSVIRVSQACVDKFNSATCDELAQAASGTEDTCFPPCTAKSTQHCVGDGTINICSNEGRTLVADCAETCKTAGKTYTGTCGLSFGAQTADKDKCWCQ